jgi:prefoldin alpha subunit
MEQKKLEEKILTYRILEARLNALTRQRNLIVNKIIEIESTLQSIDEIEKSDREMLFSLGSEAYATGKITDKKKIIVEVGANIALEKSIEEAKKTLRKRRGELENSLNAVQNEIINISSFLQVLAEEIRKLTRGAK